MPLYEYRCQECQQRFERFVKLENYQEGQTCTCGGAGDRIISSPRFIVEDVGYDCPITGEWIGSKHAHENNLAKHGCRVLETGEKEAAAKFRAKQEQDFDQKIEETVERTIDLMPSEKRERLANELESGLTAEVVRK
jgi:putative FmdB family regulatory protein